MNSTNICVFGDSITWGAFLPFRGAWANLLRNYLESKNEMIALYDLGIDANTSTDLLNRFDTEAAARKPDIIIFAVGTNDSAYRNTRKDALTPTREFKKNLTTLLTSARKLTPEIYFIGIAKGSDENTVPLPRSSTGKCYDQENISKYNAIIKEVCQKEKVEFVDIIDELKNEDFDDGLHPNLGGHQKIFEAVRRKLLKSKHLSNL